jgi:hypothetical protein
MPKRLYLVEEQAGRGWPSAVPLVSWDPADVAQKIGARFTLKMLDGLNLCDPNCAGCTLLRELAAIQVEAETIEGTID